MLGGRNERNSSIGAGRRPRFMTLLTLLMLLLGGRMFITGASDLYRVVTGKAEVLNLDGGLNAENEVILRGQVVLDNALARFRPVTLTLHALARLGLGLLYLFAVAALFSGDARARRACLLAGWTGIAVSAGNALFLVVVVRRMLPWLLPMLSFAMAQDATRAGRPAPEAVMVAEHARLFLVDVPLVVSGMGVLWSLLLIAYFRGRRVRLFYNQAR